MPRVTGADVARTAAGADRARMRPPHDPLAFIRVAWLAHGIALTVLGGLLPVVQTQITKPEWAEAMRILGFQTWAAPILRVMDRILEAMPWCIGTGLLAIAAALVAMRTGRRWPLQAIAAVHLVVVPLGAWWSHVLARVAGLGGPMAGAGEIAGLVTSLGLVVWSMVIVARAPRPAPALAA
jgi:hypothetical protein